MPPEQPARIPHPGVTFPPPLYFVVGFLAGWLLHRLFPLSLAGERGVATKVAGWILIVLGAALTTWAMATFSRHETTVIPRRPATRMVTDGPYGWSRNPMYVSMALAYLGIALLAGTVWPVVLLPLVLLLLTTFVIRREERYLADAFGAAYSAYRSRVRRWL